MSSEGQWLKNRNSYSENTRETDPELSGKTKCVSRTISTISSYAATREKVPDK